VHLDSFDQLQCTACHDPHDEGFGKFLVLDTRGSALCLACHAPIDWPSSSHATSLATWDGSLPDPWPNSDFDTVADNACENCHRSHGAESQEWILKKAVEEDNCLGCHSGNVAATNILSQITEPFRHGVELSAGVHTPNEDPTLPMARHVECTDCHNPHSARGRFAPQAPVGPPEGGAATGHTPIPLALLGKQSAASTLRGVSGVSGSGALLEAVANEYEVCFKCHGPFSMTQPVVNRQIPQNDTILQFDLGNPSYHPVEGFGRSLNVPSLFPPMTSTTIIDCGDCHANQNGPGAGGNGAAGPHGSIHPHILEREYNIIDGPPYDATLYDLCYKCHSERSILADDSFPTHRKHVVDESTPCSVCHDPHGISSTQGTDTNNSHLINFDITIVSPDPGSGLLQFEDLGDSSGRCYLQCHDVAHSPQQY
jgi:predicted CXXCH cytochrome family protein